ncbi:MAG: hypothetical protein NZM41_03990, partial [Saprospiraceae bacterium]|nr:hypothetical protein [Saprospiraceae bacterium]
MKKWKPSQPTNLACFLIKRIMFQSQNRVGKIRLLTLRFVCQAGSCGCRSGGRLLTFLAVRIVRFLMPLCTFMIGTNAHFPAVRPLREYGRESKVSGTMLLFTFIIRGKDIVFEPKAQEP